MSITNVFVFAENSQVSVRKLWLLAQPIFLTHDSAELMFSTERSRWAGDVALSPAEQDVQSVECIELSQSTVDV